METIIAYIDDADHALRELLPMRDPSRPTRWILVGCAPRMSRHISRWVNQRSRRIWREKWGSELQSHVAPSLTKGGDLVVFRLADNDLLVQTQSLRREFDAARVLDARRPKFGQELAPVTPDQPLAGQHNTMKAVGTTSAMGAVILLAAD